LGIPEIGETTARALAKDFRDVGSLIKAIDSATRDRPGPAWIELSTVPKIGPVTLDRILRESMSLNSDKLDLFEGSLNGILKLTTAQRDSLIKRYETESKLRVALRTANSQQPKAAYNRLADNGEIGPVATESLIEFFSEPLSREALEALLSEVRVEPAEEVAQDSPISGKIIVFTGSLERMARDEAKDIADRLGAKVSSSVSKNTDLLVAGPGAGSKLKEAEKHGVKVISEEEWLRLIDR
jgi:DNA ligase (NAD+)